MNFVINLKLEVLLERWYLKPAGNNIINVKFYIQDWNIKLAAIKGLVLQSKSHPQYLLCVSFQSLSYPLQFNVNNLHHYCEIFLALACKERIVWYFCNLKDTQGVKHGTYYCQNKNIKYPWWRKCHWKWIRYFYEKHWIRLWNCKGWKEIRGWSWSFKNVNEV